MSNTEALRGLALELDGVIADCETDGAPGFDGVSLATIKRVRDALLTTPAASDCLGAAGFVVVPKLPDGWKVEQMTAPADRLLVTSATGAAVIVGPKTWQQSITGHVLYELVQALAAAPAAQVAAEGPAVGWRVRVLHHPHGMAPFWGRWQDIDAKTFAETKATGAYFEYETFELQELGVLAAAPAVVVDEEKARRIIADTIGFDFDADELQTVNADDLLRVVAALSQGKANG